MLTPQIRQKALVDQKYNKLREERLAQKLRNRLYNCSSQKFIRTSTALLTVKYAYHQLLGGNFMEIFSLLFPNFLNKSQIIFLSLPFLYVGHEGPTLKCFLTRKHHVIVNRKCTSRIGRVQKQTTYTYFREQKHFKGILARNPGTRELKACYSAPWRTSFYRVKEKLATRTSKICFTFDQGSEMHFLGLDSRTR